MKLAIASGKGGTGKTTISTNLAWVAAQSGRNVSYVDCDVEEPNGHLFLNPEITTSRSVGRLHPKVDLEKCTRCGLCGEICQYSAIVRIGQQVLVYPELCHSCNGCTLVCRPAAITQELRSTGVLEVGTSGPLRFVRGLLNIGEAMSASLIRQVKGEMIPAELSVLDCPPGTSCPVIESVRQADLVLLVTEPTPFGLNDLKLAIDMVRAMRLPLAVVINRAGVGDKQTQMHCEREGIELMAEFPEDRRVAEAYSRGALASESVPEYRDRVEKLLARLDNFNPVKLQTQIQELNP